MAVADVTQVGYGAGGRQSAYTARNRAALISAAQAVMAEIGPGATIEQLVAQAQVSPTTIYNYFESKDALFAEALDQMWRDFVLWAYDGRPPADNFGAMLDVCRKLFRADDSHPVFARVLRNTLSQPDFIIQSVSEGGTTTLKHIVKSGGLDADDFDQRLNLWAYCIAGILHRVYVSGDLSPEDADHSLQISLSIWNIGPETAGELIPRIEANS
jgi:AcrR family transcriptional regulator